jgi:hypothetical protein
VKRVRFGVLTAVAVSTLGVLVTSRDEPPRPVRSVSCAATPVDGGSVRSGPLTGLILRRYDVIDGRFRLHVGYYRDRSAGLSQKIPWFVRFGASAGRSLRLKGTRLGPRRRTFSQVFRRADGGDADGRSIFPSIIRPPTTGCWRLEFTTGKTTARLTALVRR